ncbi:hypothetical protein LEP1GSC070_1863 [Leptospira santarosai str. AIM]|nr:hypothetical protein LEP1GSC070_1863 [Leptospira santarosai str. AIM]
MLTDVCVMITFNLWTNCRLKEEISETYCAVLDRMGLYFYNF